MRVFPFGLRIALIWNIKEGKMSPTGDTRRSKYEMYKDKKGQWRWRLRAANEKIIATSGEGYTSKQNCLKGIAAVKRNARVPIVTKTAKKR